MSVADACILLSFSVFAPEDNVYFELRTSTEYYVWIYGAYAGLPVQKSCEPGRDHLRLRNLRDYSVSRSRTKQ